MTSKTDFGKHYILDCFDCDPEVIKFVASTREVLLRAVEESKATLIDDLFHQFDPVGVSGVVLISESHFSVHTWPESGFAGVDIFTCGPMEPQKAIDIIKAGFGAKKVNVKVLSRGRLDDE